MNNPETESPCIEQGDSEQLCKTLSNITITDGTDSVKTTCGASAPQTYDGGAYTFFLDGLNPNDFTSGLVRLCLEDVKKSGLSSSTLQTAKVKIFRGGTETLKREIGFGSIDGDYILRMCRLIEFPYFDAQGNVVFKRYKLVPAIGDTKYLQPKATPTMPYILPAVWAVVGKTNRALWMVEGEKKTQKLIQHGRYCIGLSGVWNFKAGKTSDADTDDKYLHPELMTFNFVGRQVYLAYDADMWTNPQVRYALYELGYKLMSRGANVHIVSWDATRGKGIDDYLMTQPGNEDTALQSLENASVNINDFVSTEHVDEVVRALSQTRIDDIKKEITYKKISGRIGISATALRKAVGQKKDEYVAKSKPAASPVTIPEYHLSDMGNSERLIYYHGKNIRYCYAMKKWLIWNGHRWAVDDGALISGLAKDVVRKIYQETDRADSKDRREAIASHAIKSEAETKIKAMVNLACSEASIKAEHLDADEWKLALANGVIDLRTYDFFRYDDTADTDAIRDMMITKTAQASYDETASCPTFLQFLGAVIPDSNVRDFLQKAFGYSLTGSQAEQCVFICYGTGANGKSTLLNITKEIMGDYASHIQAETLTVKHAGNGANNDIARLRGARYVTTTETEDGKRLAEALVKQLTGGDTMSARFLYSEFFEFTPQFKVFLATNHKPIIRGDDYAIWRRIRLIPFTIQIPPEQQDKELMLKLREEKAGILNWLLAGLFRYQAEGLTPPPAVLAATDGYRQEMDVIYSFLADCCTVGTQETVQSSRLYAGYKEWALSNGEYVQSQTAFAKKLVERGFEKSHTMVGNIWRGITLKN